MIKKKVKSAKKLRPAKEITVKSRAYGEHTRAARGSKTPVELNDAFKLYKTKTILVNTIAKRVHDLLKVCGAGFKEAMLWQVMLSRMRKAASDEVMDLLIALKGMELNSKYPLQRFINTPVSGIQSGKKKITVSISNLMPPDIRSDDTQYYFEMFLLVLGKEVKQDRIISKRTEWMDKEKSAGEIIFHSDVPNKAKYCALCLHFATGKNEKETGTMASRAMRIVSVGKV